MNKKELRKLVREVLYDELRKGIKLDEIKGGRTWHLRNDEVHIAAVTPKIHLEGTETDAKNISIRENAGRVEIYDEAAAAKATPPIFSDGQIHKGAFLTDTGSVTVTIPIGGGSVTAVIDKPTTLTKIGAILTFTVKREAPIVDDVYEASYGITPAGDAIGLTLSAGTGTTLTAEALMMEF